MRAPSSLRRSIAVAAPLMLSGAALAACSGGAATSEAGGAGGAITGATVGAGASTSTSTASTTGSNSTGSTAGGGGTGGSDVVPDPGPSTFVIAGIDQNRNRTLDTLAQRRGTPDRCGLWSTMTIVEKGIFLTHTDLLGHRSCFDNASVPVAQMSGGACTPSSCSCADNQACSCPIGSAMALDHVFSLWAVNGSDLSCCAGVNCCNGGGEWHRTFFSADDHLIANLRSVHAGLPEWAGSNDFAGPHDPFTQSSETIPGSPRGQTHFWSADGEASVLDRNGVKGVSDPHIVELDNDYNILHDSSPEGYYSSTYGRAEYKRSWNWPSDAGHNRGDGLPTSFAGNGAPANISELSGDDTWSPHCASAVITGVTAPDGVHAGGVTRIEGTGLLAAGNIVNIRTRTMAVALGASSPLLLSEAPDHLMVQLPKDLGAGEGLVYVEIAGVITNVFPVTLAP
jgi:hypothetical protein